MKAILKRRLNQVLLIGMLGLTSCHNSITGLYQHEICEKSPDCFLYDLCEDGTFTYWYSQDIMGSATITGDWTVSQDTLYLTPDPYLFETESKLIASHNPEIVDSIHIQISTLTKYFKNQQDTIIGPWIVLFDEDETIYRTDFDGFLTVPAREIKEITIRDYFIGLDLPPTRIPSDNVFKLEENINDLRIFIADNEVAPMVFGVDDKLLIKSGELFSIPSGKYRQNQYTRVTDQCGSLKGQ